MDAFEVNKIAGAMLFALLVLFGARSASDILFKAHKPEQPGYAIEVAETTEKPGEAAPGEKAPPLASLLAGADAGKGQAVAKKCTACHTFDEGGANKIGPNLYGVIGRPLGAVEGFAYSAALKDKGGNWDYEALDHFIASPNGFIDGTKMAFPGVKRAGQRADLILYLRQQHASPPPLPETEAAPAPAGAAPADKPAEPEPEAQTPAEKPAEATPAEKQPESGQPSPAPSQGG